MSVLENNIQIDVFRLECLALRCGSQLNRDNVAGLNATGGLARRLAVNAYGIQCDELLQVTP